MSSPTPYAAPTLDRYYFLASGVVIYVALAALSQRADALLPLLLAALLPGALALVWRYARRPSSLGAQVHPTALGAFRVAAWGLATWLAARSGPAGQSGFDLAANLGAGAATVAGAVALARIPAWQGLSRPPRSARSLDAAAFCAVAWGVAVALPAGRALWPGTDLLLEPLTVDYATSVASIGTTLVLLAAAVRLRVSRRLELGVADRAAGAVVLTLASISVAIPATAADVAAPDRVLPLAAACAALGSAWAASAREPTEVSSGLRGALAVMIVGAPVALLAHGLSRSLPQLAPQIALGGAVAAIAAGLLARSVAAPLGPEQSRWLQALQDASRAALSPEPDAAIVATLEALQGLERTVHTRPELWRVEPEEALSVDVAGYLHEQPGRVPEQVYALSHREPERTLRRDVLEALQVRQPEARPALSWLDSREAFAVTLLCQGSEDLGLLVFPKGTRDSPITLEEARAARQLADRLAAVLAVSSALSRHRQREERSTLRADVAEREVERLRSLISDQVARRSRLVDALAQRARTARYGARSRLALEQLERLGRAGADVTLRLAPGVDALTHAAVIHAAGDSREGPLLPVDATRAELQQAEPWQALDGPLELAAGGTLLIENLTALSPEAQDSLAIALADRERHRDSALPPARLVATVGAPLSPLLASGAVTRALCTHLERNVVSLPSLIERPEDLRALVMDALCRSGVRCDGEPLGIEARALSALLDHSWPGNDAELSSVVERAAHVAAGSRVTLQDLSTIGFVSDDEPAPQVGLRSDFVPRSASASVRAPRDGFREGQVASLRAPALPRLDASAVAVDPAPAGPGRSKPTRRRRRR